MAVIATNTAANTALVFLNRNIDNQSDSLARISSGSRIVTASDDAAGLAVGSQLNADVGVLRQAAVNTQNAQAVLQVADGGLSQIGDILERANSLTAQAQSGAVDAASRGFINAEFQQLITEIADIAGSLNFNGANLIDGTFNENFLVGTDSGDVIAANLSGVNFLPATTNIDGTDVTSQANAAAAQTAVQTDIALVSTARATVGSLGSRFEFRGNVVANQIDNLEDAASAILDVDIAAEQTNLTNSQVLTEAAIAGLSQANQLTESLLSLIQ